MSLDGKLRQPVMKESPLVRREAEPVLDSLTRRHATNLQGRVGLPLNHRNVAALVILPDCARGRSWLGDDAVRDALLGPEHGAVKDRGVEGRERKRDAVGLHGPRDRSSDWKRGKCSEDGGGRVGAVAPGMRQSIARLRPAAICKRVHVVGH